MMKKRILASSMASVMALSAASSLVAFAADTEKETATKATLEAYIDEIDAFLDDGVEEYGSLQAAQLEVALEQAQAILDDSDSDNDDYTVAYQMLKAVKASLKQYTLDELEALVKSYASTYATNNDLNEDFDFIYKESTWTAFEDAYDEASDIVDNASEDLQEITDAYVALEDAYSSLSKLTTITKTQFSSIMTEYAKIVNYGSSSYETWRRGTCSVTPSYTSIKDKNGDKISLKKAVYLTFDDLLDIVITGTTVDFYASQNNLQKGGNTYLTDQSDDDVDLSNILWIGNDYADEIAASTVISGETGATDTTLQAWIENEYALLVNENYTKVSDPEMVAAYHAAVDAVNVFNGWTADSTVTGTQSKTNSLVDSYRAKLVEAYGNTIVNTDLAALYTDADDSAVFAYSSDDGTITNASGAAVKLLIDTNTGLIALDSSDALLTEWTDGTDTYVVVTGGSVDETVLASAIAAGANLKAITIKAGADITKYIPITSSMVSAATTDIAASSLSTTLASGGDHNVALVSALEAVEAYNKAAWELDSAYDFSSAYDDVLDALDEYTTVKSATGSRTEWTLIYRYLSYALSDAFDTTSSSSLKLADVKKYLAAADEIIELTAETSVFGSANAALVKARASAYAWLGEAEANKKTYVENDSTYGAFSYLGDDDKTANDVAKSLKGLIETLEEMYAAYPLSFGEIADTIAEVANALDAGAYKQNVDTIKELLTSVSYELSTLDEDNVTEDKGMVAFDVNGEFQPDERLFIGDDDDDAKDAEEELYNDYVALLAAIAGAEESPAIAGDVDGDGTVSVIDAQTVLNAALGKVELTAAQEAVADVDGDGSVTILDAQAILKMALNG